MQKFLWQNADFRFFRLPTVLYTDENYARISEQAKVLYAMMISRACLSEINGWCDEDGVYFYFSIPEVCRTLHCGHNKAVRMLKELESNGLLVKHRQFGFATKLYLSPPEGINAKAEQPTEDCEPLPSVTVQRYEEALSWVAERFYSPINDSTIHAVELARIKQIIADTVASDQEFQKIGNQSIATELIKRRFAQLDNETVYGVIDNLVKDRKNIKNERAYILSALYNSACDYSL